MALRNDQYSVTIAHNERARLDSNVTQRNRLLMRLETHPILTRTHVAAAAEERIGELEAQRHVATNTVDHCAGNAAHMGGHRQQVAPHRDVAPSLVVDDDDGAGRHVVDVVANTPPGRAARPHPKRERRAGHTSAREERSDAQALPGNTKPVESVADGGRRETPPVGRRGPHFALRPPVVMAL